MNIQPYGQSSLAFAPYIPEEPTTYHSSGTADTNDAPQTNPPNPKNPTPNINLDNDSEYVLVSKITETDETCELEENTFLAITCTDEPSPEMPGMPPESIQNESNPPMALPVEATNPPIKAGSIVEKIRPQRNKKTAVDLVQRLLKKLSYEGTIPKTLVEARQHYLKLLLKHHPDKNGDSNEATGKSKRIVNVYLKLLDLVGKGNIERNQKILPILHTA